MGHRHQGRWVSRQVSPHALGSRTRSPSVGSPSQRLRSLLHPQSPFLSRLTVPALAGAPQIHSPLLRGGSRVQGGPSLGGSVPDKVTNKPFLHGHACSAFTPTNRWTHASRGTGGRVAASPLLGKARGLCPITRHCLCKSAKCDFWQGREDTHSQH